MNRRRGRGWRNHRASAGSSFNPATLAWSEWWDGAGYSGSTVTGKASAGGSGSINLTALGTPAAGTVNGRATILLDGTDDVVYATDATALMTVSAWTFSLVGKITSSPVDNTDPYLNPAFGTASDANWAIAVDSAGNVEAYQYVAGANKIATVAWTTGVLTCIQARYDGVNISARLGKGAWVNTAAGSPVGIAGFFRIGSNYNGTQFLTGELCELAVADTAFSDDDLDSMADAMAARWGVSV